MITRAWPGSLLPAKAAPRAGDDEVFDRVVVDDKVFDRVLEKVARSGRLKPTPKTAIPET